MGTPELRWRQRLQSLGRALGQLEAALAALDADPASEAIGNSSKAPALRSLAQELERRP